MGCSIITTTQYPPAPVLLYYGTGRLRRYEHGERCTTIITLEMDLITRKHKVRHHCVCSS
jgi:hypothetical protein